MHHFALLFPPINVFHVPFLPLFTFLALLFNCSCVIGTHTYIHTHILPFTYQHTHKHIHTCIHTNSSLAYRTYICTQQHSNTNTHIPHIRTYFHIHICTHKYIPNTSTTYIYTLTHRHHPTLPPPHTCTHTYTHIPLYTPPHIHTCMQRAQFI